MGVPPLAATLLLSLVSVRLVTSEAPSLVEVSPFGSLTRDKGAISQGYLLRHCLSRIETPKAAVFPEDVVKYEAARRTFNWRTLRRPAGIFYAHNTNDVSAAVQCARAAKVKVSPASGRQGFTGDAVQNGYLVIDVAAMNQIFISDDHQTLTAGPGASGGMIQAFLHDTGIPGAEVPSGYCTWVSVAGYTLGGGMGPAGRYLGLGCDQLIGLEMVLYNGTVIRADRGQHPDLLWASCGGGGGTFGIVTSLEFKVNLLPNNGKLTIIEARYKQNKEPAVKMFMRLQDWLPTMDRRFGLDGLSLGSGLTGPWLYFHGIFLGNLTEAQAGLNAAGMLEDLDETFIVDETTSDVCHTYPHGLRLQGERTMYDFYYETALNWSMSLYSLPTPWMLNAHGPVDGGYRDTPFQAHYMHNLLRGRSPFGPVVGGMLYNAAFLYSQARVVGMLDKNTIEHVMDTFDIAHASCNQTNIMDVSATTLLTTKFSAGCSYISLGHVLGGAYADRRNDDTAFPHRDKWFVIAGQAFVSNMLSSGFGPDQVTRAFEEVDGFVRALEPEPQAGQQCAYVNYMNPADNSLLLDWQHGYFGDNYPRLLQIKIKYDPEGLFTKPMTVGAPLHSSTRKLRSPH